MRIYNKGMPHSLPQNSINVHLELTLVFYEYDGISTIVFMCVDIKISRCL